MATQRKPLDTVVKLAIGVFFGSFALIFGGMFLTRPDRSIPPYSIGAQEGSVVAVHVPVYTSDGGLEALIHRFQGSARRRDFGRMKIQPTTPEDPGGRYRKLTIYVFTHEAWAEPDILRRYLTAAGSSSAEDRALREAFEKAVRAFYRLEGLEEEGRIGPIYGVLGSAGTPATAAYTRLLFKGPVGGTASEPRSSQLEPSPQ
ncbi:MAG TPA: hypothetical protein VHQ67_05900 [Nitrospiraceae bacterium]|jgi:hypothetical protein|nr:hypothetical protein [Nitrospiraceae bacterium]